jgi:hypothetical protein
MGAIGMFKIVLMWLARTAMARSLTGLRLRTYNDSDVIRIKDLPIVHPQLASQPYTYR